MSKKKPKYQLLIPRREIKSCGFKDPLLDTYADVKLALLEWELKQDFPKLTWKQTWT